MRTALRLVLAVSLGAALAACGGRDVTGAPATRTTATSPQPDGALTRDTFADRVFGAITKSGSAKVSFASDNGEEQPNGTGEVEYGDSLAMRIKLDAGYGGRSTDDLSDVILLGKTMYEKGISEGNRPTDGKYGAMDLHALESMGMPDIPGLLDPRSKAGAFPTAVTSFKQAGRAQALDGVEAIPYAITIDPSKAQKEFDGSPGDALHLTFYVGPDDLPRKLVVSDPYSKFTATYSDWGTPVAIQPPMDDQVNRVDSAPN